MNLVRAELIKIATLRATWISLLVAAAGEALRWRFLPVYAIAAIAMQVFGSEYRGGQWRLTLAAAPRRGRLYAAKLAAALGGAGVAALPLLVTGIVLKRPGAPMLWLLSVLLSGAGAGLAAIARGALVPLAGLGLAAVASAAGVLPSFRRLLPQDAMADALAGRSSGLPVIAAWAALPLLAGALILRRRDA